MTTRPGPPPRAEAGDAPIVRPMTTADIPAGLRLCRASGWNQVARDWEQFLHLNGQGARVIEQAGDVVGTVTTLRYGQFGWIAMVLVDPAVRGHGLGTRLLSVGLELLADLPCVRLDATPAGERIYRTRGFVEERHLARMTRPPGSGSPPAGESARPMTAAELAGVARWDADAFGADRRLMLEWLYAGAPEYAWIGMRGTRLAGYMLGRPGFSFEHLGPVVAESVDVAMDLVTACLSAHPQRRFGIDAMGDPAGWVRWLEGIGFQGQRPFLRMAHNPARIGLPERHFASVGPEFG